MTKKTTRDFLLESPKKNWFFNRGVSDAERKYWATHQWEPFSPKDGVWAAMDKAMNATAVYDRTRTRFGYNPGADEREYASNEPKRNWVSGTVRNDGGASVDPQMEETKTEARIKYHKELAKEKTKERQLPRSERIARLKKRVETSEEAVDEGCGCTPTSRGSKSQKKQYQLPKQVKMKDTLAGFLMKKDRPLPQYQTEDDGRLFRRHTRAMEAALDAGKSFRPKPDSKKDCGCKHEETVSEDHMKGGAPWSGAKGHPSAKSAEPLDKPNAYEGRYRGTNIQDKLRAAIKASLYQDAAIGRSAKRPSLAGFLHNKKGTKGPKGGMHGGTAPSLEGQSTRLEDVEQIDEKNWIAGAIKHPGAEKRAAARAGMSTQAYMRAHEHDSGKAGARARLGLRLSHMNKEEAEPLDELKASTLRSYVNKATNQIADLGNKGQQLAGQQRPYDDEDTPVMAVRNMEWRNRYQTIGDYNRTMSKRLKGINMAANRIRDAVTKGKRKGK